MRDRRSGEIAVLTAAHVIGGLFPWPTEETEVVGYGDLHHDAEHDTATAPLSAMKFALGRLERSVPAQMATSTVVDAAIARAVSSRELLNSVNQRPVTGMLDIRDVVDATIPVHMLGARSKRRSGVLHTALVADTIRIAQSDNYVFYRHACLIHGDDGQFAQPGDSGSVVVDDHDQAVAMVVGLYASHDENAHPPALAVPIAAVLEELDVELLDGSSVTTAPIM